MHLCNAASYAAPYPLFAANDETKGEIIYRSLRLLLSLSLPSMILSRRKNIFLLNIKRIIYTIHYSVNKILSFSLRTTAVPDSLRLRVYNYSVRA